MIIARYITTFIATMLISACITSEDPTITDKPITCTIANSYLDTNDEFISIVSNQDIITFNSDFTFTTSKTTDIDIIKDFNPAKLNILSISTPITRFTIYKFDTLTNYLSYRKILRSFDTNTNSRSYTLIDSADVTFSPPKLVVLNSQILTNGIYNCSK
jgi:hypothetical protein